MIFPKAIDYIHFDTIDSTHEWAKKNISLFHPGRLTAITTEEQTSGRGRIKNRSWVSEKGNFHFTGFFYLPKTFPFIANLAQLLTLTTVQLLGKNEIYLQIKWPNDLLYDNKKLGGAMTELVDCKDQWGCILGLGLNVNTAIQTDQPTTSVREISGKLWELNAFKLDFLELLQQNLALFCEKGIHPFIPYFNEHLAYKGKNISCIAGEKKISGIVMAINDEGKLRLLQRDDSIISLSNGEIHTLRESN